ncbi:MAG: hypothetical protein AAGF12_03625 [Myxococcota bacterium]
MSVTGRLAWALLAPAGLLWAGEALAQSPLDEGYRLLDEGDFEEALSELERAEAGPLTRDDFIRLLEGRAIGHLALRNLEGFEAALSDLASVDPRHEFSEHLPPDLATGFARVRDRSPGELRLEIDVEAIAEQVVLVARILHAPSFTVGYRLHARNDGEWRSAENAELRLPDRGLSVEYYGTLLGPGGAVLHRLGSADEPETFLRRPETSSAPEESSEFPWLVVVGIGAAVLVAVGVGVTIALLSSGGGTQPRRPVIP